MELVGRFRRRSFYCIGDWIKFKCRWCYELFIIGEIVEIIEIGKGIFWVVVVF